MARTVPHTRALARPPRPRPPTHTCPPPTPTSPHTYTYPSPPTHTHTSLAYEQRGDHNHAGPPPPTAPCNQQTTRPGEAWGGPSQARPTSGINFGPHTGKKHNNLFKKNFEASPTPVGQTSARTQTTNKWATTTKKKNEATPTIGINIGPLTETVCPASM